MGDQIVMLLNGICIGAIGVTFVNDWLDRRGGGPRG